MRCFPANFVYFIAAMVFLQVDCKAGEDPLKEKIVRETLSQNEPALVKVGTTGVTSLEFPYRIDAIDGYGFSSTPGTGDLFQISYTKGTNYFSVRALKPGVTGNLTVVLDQKAYSLFFEESSNPTFLTIFESGSESRMAEASVVGATERKQVDTCAQPASDTDLESARKEHAASNPEGLAFNQPPGNYIPTATAVGQAVHEPQPHSVQARVAGSAPQSAESSEKHTVAKRAPKKSEPKSENNAKENVAKSQKPAPKKLFGWL
jgi:hypothetical protein